VLKYLHKKVVPRLTEHNDVRAPPLQEPHA